MNRELLMDKAGELQLHEYGFLNPRDITFHPELRQYCEANTCGEYDTTWACPPAIGSVEECRSRCHAYNKMLLFTSLFPWTDWADSEGIKQLTYRFKQTTRQLDELLAPIVGEHLTLATGGCDICGDCTYPHAPCRFPDRLIPSMSGYGMLIKDLAGMAGVSYDNGEDTITLFGAILYNVPQ